MKRQATQHGCLPSLLGDGDIKRIKIMRGSKNIFCTGLTRVAKAEQKSLVPARHAQWTYQGRTPSTCTLWVPIFHHSFNSQQRPLLSSLSGASHQLRTLFYVRRTCFPSDTTYGSETWVKTGICFGYLCSVAIEALDFALYVSFLAALPLQGVKVCTLYNVKCIKNITKGRVYFLKKISNPFLFFYCFRCSTFIMLIWL